MGASLFSLVLLRNSPKAKKFDFLSASLSDLSEIVLFLIYHNSLLARLSRTRGNVEKSLTAAQKQYSYRKDSRVREIPVFKRNDSEFVDGPSLAVSTSSSKTKDRPT